MAAVTVAAFGSCTDADGPGTGSRETAMPQIVWRTALAPSALPLGDPATDGERVFIQYRGITALRVSDGTQIWGTPPGTFALGALGIVERDGRVYVAEAAAHAFDAATGRELWRVQLVEDAALCIPAADDRALYFGTTGPQHIVYALNVENGHELWSTRLGPDWEFDGRITGVALSGDTLYVAANQDRSQNGFLVSAWLFALDRATGSILWSFVSGEGDERRALLSAPVVAGRLLIADDWLDNAIFAVDRFVHSEIWRVPGVPGFGGPLGVPVVRGDTVYRGSGDTFVYAADVQTGQLLWKSTHADGSIDHVTVCGSSVLAEEEAIEIFDRHTGTWKGTILNVDSDFITSGFATLGDTLVFASGPEAVYALRCPK
ncbi:MAG TPA: PQQ-binding-like beta-propeller repeat protein [Gemmatimonadaceae bacterium]|nr:PQQ-binding-like beta-propeller repeat protein [Gemmatimonadaceae bacterium]